MSTSRTFPSADRNLGISWLIDKGTVYMRDADPALKAKMVQEAESAHRMWSQLRGLLQLSDTKGGVILERETSTLLAGGFETMDGVLAVAEGELIEGPVKPHFDYCFARM